jgi:hypothetical protein
MGARNAGNPHVACDVEGAGDVVWVGPPGHTGAPALDPTDERGWETGRWPWAPSYRAHPRLYHARRTGRPAQRGAVASSYAAWSGNCLAFPISFLKAEDFNLSRSRSPAAACARRCSAISSADAALRRLNLLSRKTSSRAWRNVAIVEGSKIILSRYPNLLTTK